MDIHHGEEKPEEDWRKCIDTRRRRTDNNAVGDQVRKASVIKCRRFSILLVANLSSALWEKAIEADVVGGGGDVKSEDYFRLLLYIFPLQLHSVRFISKLLTKNVDVVVSGTRVSIKEFLIILTYR